MGGRLRPTLADEIHITGVSGVVATKFVALGSFSAVAQARVSASRSSGSLGATTSESPWMKTIAIAAKTHMSGILLPLQLIMLMIWR